MLTYSLPLIGFLSTVILVMLKIHGFSEFLHQSNVSSDQIKDQVGEITTGLATAIWPTWIGLMGWCVGVILLVVRSQQMAPPAAPERKTSIY